MITLPYRDLVDVHVDASSGDVTRDFEPQINSWFKDVRIHKTDASPNKVIVRSRGVVLAEVTVQNDFVTLRNHGTELRLLP